MKVLFLSPRFYPDIGGVEKHVLAISKELIKRGFEISVLTEKQQNYHSGNHSDRAMHEAEKPSMSGKTQTANLDGIGVYRLRFGKAGAFKKFRIWKQIWENRSLISNADVVHCHDVFIWYLPFRFLYPRKKIFTTFHGWEGKFPPTKNAKLVRRISEKLSHGNICVGKYIEKWYGTKATGITYGAVRISNFKYQISKENKTRLKILFVGRISEDNGVNLYTDVLKLLQNQNVSFEFSAIGDGSLKKEFEKFGKVLGFVENSQKYIQQADVIFASSYLSILESLVHNKLVISVYDNPLKKDYLTLTPFKTNIIVTDKSQYAVDKMKEFMNNTKESQISQGAVWAREQTWEKLTQQYMQLWK